MSDVFRFRLVPSTALLCLALFLLAGCETAKEPLPISSDAAGVSTYCRDWARLQHAEFLYENNVWGQGAISGGDRLQCLLKRVVEGNVQYGWRWQWPRRGGNVKAYPEVIYGYKPWSTYSTTANLPRRITEINELTVAYDVSMRARGRYNLAFDIWVTDNDRPTPSAITHEIMIWVGERAHAFEPEQGGPVKRVTIGGAMYDLHIRPRAEWLAEHDAPDVGFIAFNALKAQLSGVIDLKEFLDYLTENGNLPADGYVASVELGNEVVHGAGELWLNGYEISVN